MAGGWRGDAVPLSRMLYVDDSGSVESGLIVYGWIECSPEGWRHALRAILELRKALYRDRGGHSKTRHATGVGRVRGPTLRPGRSTPPPVSPPPAPAASSP